jgi:hypothetical protein
MTTEELQTIAADVTARIASTKTVPMPARLGGSTDSITITIAYKGTDVGTMTVDIPQHRVGTISRFSCLSRGLTQWMDSMETGTSRDASIHKHVIDMCYAEATSHSRTEHD